MSTLPALLCRATLFKEVATTFAWRSIHWLNTSATTSGEATLGDGSTGFASSRASTSLPIPNVGAAYQYSPSAKWLYGFRFDWFSASVGDYSGGIWNAMANVNYQFAEHFGLGVGCQCFQLDGEVTDDKWRGDLRIRYDGPFVTSPSS